MDRETLEIIEAKKNKIRSYFSRWNSLIYKKEAVSILYPDISCPDLFFANQVQVLEEDDMELLMLQLEYKDDEIYTLIEQLKRGTENVA